MIDPKQIERYFSMLFRHVDWSGQIVSLLGVAEKGTPREGTDAQRVFLGADELGKVVDHAKRWASEHTATFVVPAALFPSARLSGKAKLEEISLLTAIILDIDSGDVPAKLAYASAALGPPSMVVHSGGATAEGAEKRHVYWLLNETSNELARIGRLRHVLATKVGGDAAFQRVTQIIRVPGTVHAKHGRPALCSIVDETAHDYSLDDLAEIIETMAPMPGLPEPKQAQLPMLQGGVMDFSAFAGSAGGPTVHQTMVTDITEGGTDDHNRWTSFTQVAGHYIHAARIGAMSLEEAAAKTHGWMLAHMDPQWPELRFRNEFTGVLRTDIENHGPVTAAPIAQAVSASLNEKGGIKATPATWPAPADIPPRPWIFGQWLMRGVVTAVAAPGGVGKSSLMAALTLSLASGKDLLGKTIFGGPKTAWYWNLEDNQSALERSRVAAMLHFDVKPWDCREKDGRDRLYVDSGPQGATLCTAIEDRNGFTIVEPVMQAVCDELIARGADVLIIDPFVSSHAVNENDNTKIDAVSKAWARVAQQANCSIVLVHHTPKMRDKQATAEDLRGAVSLNNTARVTLVLNRMSPEDCLRYGLDPYTAHRYFNVADGKHNLTLAGGLDWFMLESVALNNGDGVNEGDSIGVVTPWKPPSVMEGVTLDHLAQVQQVVALNDCRKLGTGEDWVGQVVARVTKLDAKEDKGDIQRIVNRWLRDGFLVERTGKDGGSRVRPFVAVGKPAFPMEPGAQ